MTADTLQQQAESVKSKNIEINVISTTDQSARYSIGVCHQYRQEELDLTQVERPVTDALYEHTTNTPFYQNCHNCAKFGHAKFDGEVIHNNGICTHIAFLGSGFAKRDENSALVKTGRIRSRLPSSEAKQMFEDGWYYLDIIFQKKAANRRCDHWTHPLFTAKNTLAHFKDSHTNYEFLKEVPELWNWFENGMPTEPVSFSKLHKTNNFDSVVEYPVRTILESYKPCQTCAHYRPEVDALGVVTPNKGQCAMGVSNKGVFDLTKSETKPTYSFFSCGGHTMSKESANAPTFPNLSPRLHIFAETNPVDIPYSLQYALRDLPILNNSRYINKETHEALLNSNMLQLVKDKFDQVDFQRFYEDHHLTSVNTYFQRRLKAHSKEADHEWGRFAFYRDAENSLYGTGQPEANVSHSFDEDDVMSMFNEDIESGELSQDDVLSMFDEEPNTSEHAEMDLDDLLADFNE